MSAFNFTDYLLYASAKDVNVIRYASVAASVMQDLITTYGVYVEETVLDYKHFQGKKELSLNIPVVPIVALNNITYDGDIIDDTTYTWYGDDILLTSTISDIRKPIVLNINVGYAEVPVDLKLAIYRHIDFILFGIDKATNNVSKVVNSTGNSTSFRSDALPAGITNVYEAYSHRELVRF